MKFTVQRFLPQVQHILFVLLIFFLPTQLGKHFWPPFAIVHGIRVDYLSPTLYLTDILTLLLIIVTVVLYLYERGAFIKKVRLNVGVLILFFFLIILLARLSFSLEPLAGLYGWVKLVEMIALWWCFQFVLKRKHYTLLVYSYALGMLMQSMLAIAQFYNQSSLGGWLYWIGERTFTSSTPGIANASIQGSLLLRPYGTLPHPNVLSAYLMVGLILISTYISYRKQLNKRILFLLLVMAIGSVALLLTFSRVTLFFFFCSGLVVLFSRRFQRQVLRQSAKRLVMFFLAGGLLVSLLLAVGNDIFFRFAQTSFTESAVVERKVLAEAALTMFVEHPLLGVGLNNYFSHLPPFSPTSRVVLMQPVHNIALWILSQTGAVGLLIVLYGLVTIVRNVIYGKATFFVMTLLIYFWFTGMFDHYWLTVQQGLLLTALIYAITTVDNRTI